MTSYLGPESPRPFSVAAERYFQQINPATGFHIRPTHDRSQPSSRCRFGEQYEREFAFYLAKHAEVNCSDRLCLVGEESEWASIVQERLFLIKPVHFIDCKLHQGMSHASDGKERLNQSDTWRKTSIDQKVNWKMVLFSASPHKRWESNRTNRIDWKWVAFSSLFGIIHQQTSIVGDCWALDSDISVDFPWQIWWINHSKFWLNILRTTDRRRTWICHFHSDAIKEQLSAHTFDRIILLNCLHQVNNPPPADTRSESRASNASANSHLISFIHLLRKSLASQGKLVIIHREPNINTLPLPVEVITNWYDADAHSARLIEQLHRERKKDLELVWEMETIKFSLQKLIWFNLLIHRTFYPLTLTSQKQVRSCLFPCHTRLLIFD